MTQAENEFVHSVTALHGKDNGSKDFADFLMKFCGENAKYSEKKILYDS